MQLNYFIIPLLTILTAVTGSVITSRGMSWYKTIIRPGFTPPGSIIGAIWTIIFILSASSLLIVWNSAYVSTAINMTSGQIITAVNSAERNVVVLVFIFNAILNVLWSWLFFSQQRMLIAFYEALVLDLTVVVLIILIWPASIIAAMLLLPYAIWGAFASFLTYRIWRLNLS